MNRSLILVLAVAAILVTVPAAAREQSPLSLTDAVTLARQSNRTLELGRVQAALARAAYYVASDAVPPGPATPEQIRARTTERQALASWRIADHACRHLDAVVAYQVETAYYAVLQSRRMMAVAVEALAAANRQQSLAESLRRAGTASDFDLLEGQMAAANADAALAGARAAVLAAEMNFNAVLGRDLDCEVYLIDVLDDLSPEGELPASECLERDALAHRLEIKQGEEMVSVRRFELEAADKFGLEGSPGHELARLQLVAAELELELARDRIRLELRQIVASLAEAEARVRASRTAAATRAGHLRLAELRFQHGAGTSLELSMARLARDQAALAVAAAGHDYQAARARLRLAVGQ